MPAPLLLIPGMMCDGRLYEPQIAAFSGQYPVHLAPITAHDDVDALTDEILRNAPDTFALAGLSMGGIVAMAIMAQAPSRVHRLALLDTNPRAELEEIKARRQPQIDQVMANGSSDLAGLKAVLTNQMIPHYQHSDHRKSEIDELCVDMAITLGPKVFERQSLALRDRPGREQTLSRVNVPTLILTGEDDRLCPMDRHTQMHELVKGSELVVIEKAGHLTTLEQPEATNVALRRWLEA